MRTARLTTLATTLVLLFATSRSSAQAPAGSTGVCGDGTYTSAKTKSGACSNHGGVKTWMGTPTPAAAPAPKPAPPPKPAPAPPPAPRTASRPADATGRCSDGSYTSAKTKSGACSNHGGVKDWYAAAVTAPPPPAPRPAPAPPAAPSPKVAPIPGAPAKATALCNDGSYSESQHRSGTCSSHKGVKQWLKDIPSQ